MKKVTEFGMGDFLMDDYDGDIVQIVEIENGEYDGIEYKLRQVNKIFKYEGFEEIAFSIRYLRDMYNIKLSEDEAMAWLI